MIRPITRIPDICAILQPAMNYLVGQWLHNGAHGEIAPLKLQYDGIEYVLSVRRAPSDSAAVDLNSIFDRDFGEKLVRGST